MTIDDRRLDPDAPLPGAPDPWAETDMPSARDGPPWHMTEMIEAEPALAERILQRLAKDGSAARLADAIRGQEGADGSIAVVGCGTSEHGAMAVATILGEADSRVDTTSMQAFEASLGHALQGIGLVIAVSHEGATWATMRALEAARAGGGTTALITASRRAPAAELADLVIETGELDQSWCHTVGYLSPIVAAIAVAGALGQAPDGDQMRGTLAGALAADAVAATETIVGALAGFERIIVVGGGVDRITARELVLKIEEGTHLPAAFRHVETLLHGHLAGMDERTGLIAIGADDRGGVDRARRIAQGLRAVRALGIPSGGLLTPTYAQAIPAELTPAGRVVISAPGTGIGVAGARALLATAIPLQLLTERIARVRGVNPDPIRRDDPRYLAAAAAASPEA